jgi:PhzF family phenazine biosynthesis protein
MMITFKRVPYDDLQRAIDIELASYPADEAASLQSLTYRQREAPNAFIGMYEQNMLIGFICSTCTNSANLEEETMSTHVKNGTSLCIHSVVVSETHRKRGLATRMLRYYVTNVPYDFPKVRQMRLISKAHLINFYTKAGGFEFVQLWPYHHGADHWFEMKLSYDVVKQYQVDAFVIPGQPFSGNPAAVAVIPPTRPAPDDSWYQKVAAANALSETAFVSRRQDQALILDDTSAVLAYDLRWFTPTTEVDLCGHATLATAYALFEVNQVGRDSSQSGIVSTINFHTKNSGVLTVIKDDDKGTLWMNFPSDPTTSILESKEQEATLNMVIDGLGLKSKDDVLALHKGKFDILVEVSQETFLNIHPKMDVLINVQARGVVVTCVGGGGSSKSGDSNDGNVHFRSRWFGPQSGVPEDPVTGSAHCMLACYWGDKLNKLSMVGQQCSSRGGIVGIELNENKPRVSLSGQCHFFSEGKLSNSLML